MNAKPALPSKATQDCSRSDCIVAVLGSFEKLSSTAQTALTLLAMTGFAGARGDTADDLRNALVVHGHLLREFIVKVRTAEGTNQFSTDASSSYNAYRNAADDQGDTPCAITVLPIWRWPINA
jgi:hypothetical protein